MFELVEKSPAEALELATQDETLCGRIGEFPEGAPVYNRDVRKALIQEFHLQIYYRVLNAVEVVLDVDGRRHPAAIADTLGNR